MNSQQTRSKIKSTFRRFKFIFSETFSFENSRYVNFVSKKYILSILCEKSRFVVVEYWERNNRNEKVKKLKEFNYIKKDIDQKLKMPFTFRK